MLCTQSGRANGGRSQRAIVREYSRIDTVIRIRRTSGGGIPISAPGSPLAAPTHPIKVDATSVTSCSDFAAWPNPSLANLNGFCSDYISGVDTSVHPHSRAAQTS